LPICLKRSKNFEIHSNYKKKELKTAVCNAIDIYHRHLAPDVRTEEALNCDGLAGIHCKEAIARSWRVARTLAQQGDAPVGMAPWFDRLTQRQSKEMWRRYPALEVAWYWRHKHALDTEANIAKPKGLNVARAASIALQQSGPTRWINPGRFMMGSPSDEVDREEDEILHEVTLTRGFWLADTACTQGLWRAVTGQNPSQSNLGDDYPVESVSWEDVNAFIVHINREVPDLALRLPSEAEWEYACRAGIQAPFSFGETITTDQVNYNGNYPYAGGKKGENREETVEVSALPANSWGLYQMHGNVWEWCYDWYGEYPTGPVIDPKGPEEGGRRVLRGGGWFSFGGDARSAQRFINAPGIRVSLFGFRLARGPEEQARREGSE
jgi:sulfatase modifying factor 1